MRIYEDHNGTAISERHNKNRKRQRPTRKISLLQIMDFHPIRKPEPFTASTGSESRSRRTGRMETKNSSFLSLITYCLRSSQNRSRKQISKPSPETCERWGLLRFSSDPTSKIRQIFNLAHPQKMFSVWLPASAENIAETRNNTSCHRLKTGKDADLCGVAVWLLLRYDI